MQDGEYTYRYPRPILAADSIVFTLRNDATHVLLIQRGHGPFEGEWALPGGWVDENEPVDEAGARELREETGLSNIPLRQLFSIGDPGRDPRGWCVSVVYIAVIDWQEHPLCPGDDARHVEWHPIEKLPPLAFDHPKLIRVGVEQLARHFANTGAQLVATPESYKEDELDAMWRDAERFLLNA